MVSAAEAGATGMDMDGQRRRSRECSGKEEENKSNGARIDTWTKSSRQAELECDSAAALVSAQIQCLVVLSSYFAMSPKLDIDNPTLPHLQPSQKSFKTKVKLARAQRQNR